MQLQAFPPGLGAHPAGNVLHNAAKVERRDFELQAPSLDPGHIEYLVDEGQEMLAAAVDDGEILNFARTEAEVSRRTRLEKPRMAFRGARNSWLMLVRNKLFGLIGGFCRIAATCSSLVLFWELSGGSQPFDKQLLLCDIL